MTNTIKTGDLSESERRRRQAAVDFARASVELEGFKLSKDVEAEAKQFIAGRITLAEFVQVNPNIIKVSIEVL